MFKWIVTAKQRDAGERTFEMTGTDFADAKACEDAFTAANGDKFEFWSARREPPAKAKPGPMPPPEVISFQPKWVVQAKRYDGEMMTLDMTGGDFPDEKAAQARFESLHKGTYDFISCKRVPPREVKKVEVNPKPETAKK